ncbi:hypothetical protein NSU_0638 [Novosphingobium pentaromativorans US6-1]|uniref:Uncharacterized protein n=1 Tax=Novosphingobium pentaromativorans US6-1 TaxID=1088721 RepID=G6E8G6_9SPHN|nr:hypothetical protein NSU_0638 [Novosphingobium pentaromativorans US6-1]
MEFLHVGVVGTFGKNFCNDSALIGDPQTTFMTKSFEVDGLVHV